VVTKTPHNHMLVMSLDRCIYCCGILVGKLDTELSGLCNSDGTLGVVGRLRLVL